MKFFSEIRSSLPPKAEYRFYMLAPSFLGVAQRQTKMKQLSRALCIAMVLAVSGTAIAQSSPEVKKSKNGICHAKGSESNDRTKNFKPYSSMSACLKSGGQRPK